jgi:hypothetical protein
MNTRMLCEIDLRFFCRYVQVPLLIRSLIGISVLASASAGAVNLYVSTTGNDASAGTLSSAPLRTIQRAANLAKPGYTVYVAPGKYAETITSTVVGTSTARIRFVSSTKHGAILVPKAGAYTMWTARGGYTDIDGFQLNGAGSTSVRIGIYMNGGNSSVRNSWIHDVATTSGCDSRGGGGIVVDQSRDSTYKNYNVIGNKVHNVGGGCGYIQGIYHSSSGNIMNNIVYATSQAINIGHDGHDVQVMNNTLFNNSGYGVYFGGCKEAYNNGCPTSGIKIHNNIIYANGGGIQGPVTAEDVNNSVANNLVYANRKNFDLASPSSATKTGIISADPQLVECASDRTALCLRAASPARGKGHFH